MRLLLIESEKSFGNVLADLLTQSGYQTELCDSGESGFNTARRGSFHLIITAVMLSGIDGFRLCRRLRSSGVTIPILILSRKKEISDKVRGLQSGADDYVTKPYNPPEFLARIGALLRRASLESSDPSSTFEFAGRQFDFARSTLYFKGTVKSLSERESRLLKYFIEHRGKIVTREALLRDIWGYDYTPRTRTVDTHIYWLRQTIEEDFKNPRHLVTVWGQGYQFCD